MGMTLAKLLGSNVINGLCAKSYESRISVAGDIESFVAKSFEKSFEESVGWSEECLDCIIQELTRSVYSDYRKGGLTAIASLALGSRGRLPVKAVLVAINCCVELVSDDDSKVRAAACETLFNILRLYRLRCMEAFDVLFDALAKLYGDSDMENRHLAPLLDRVLKEIVAEELDATKDHRMVEAILRAVAVPNLFAKQLCVGWLGFLRGIPNSGVYERLASLLAVLLSTICCDSSMVSGWRDLSVAADHVLSSFARDIEVRGESILTTESVNECMRVLIKYGKFQDSLTSERGLIVLFDWMGIMGTLCTCGQLCAEIVLIIVQTLASATNPSSLAALKSSHKRLLNSVPLKRPFEESASVYLMGRLEEVLPRLPASGYAIEWIKLISRSAPISSIDLLLSVEMNADIIRLMLDNFEANLVASKLASVVRKNPQMSKNVASLLIKTLTGEKELQRFMMAVAEEMSDDDEDFVLNLVSTTTLIIWNDELVGAFLKKSDAGTVCSLLVAVIGKRWLVFEELSNALHVKDCVLLAKFCEVLERDDFGDHRLCMLSSPEFTRGLVKVAMRMPQTSSGFNELFRRLQLVTVFKSV